MIYIGSIIAIVIILASAEDSHVSPQCGSLTYTPAQEAVLLEKAKFHAGLNDTTRYRGDPRPEVEEAWDDLLSAINIRVDDTWLTKMGRDASTAVKINDGKGGYAGMLDIFHHLHCLRMIRIGYTLDLYPEYQPMLSSQRGELIPMHIDHCIDELRQAVMCRADVTVLTSDWIDWHPKPWLNFNVEHECVNWDNIFRWSKEHWYDIKEAKLVHPQYVDKMGYDRVPSQQMPLYDEAGMAADDADLEETTCMARNKEGVTGSSRENNRLRRGSSWRAYLRLLGIVTVGVLAGIGTIDTLGRISQAVQQHKEAYEEVQTVHDCFRACGYTAAEAIARGCQFEEADMRWEHPRCIDAELAAEYRRMGPEPDGSWVYEVDDESATEGVPINELRRRPVNATELSMYVRPGKVVYASMRHHLTHCIFRWRKQFRAPFVGTRWPSQPGWEENHIKHCMDVILNKRDIALESFITRVVFESP
ncbi:Cyclochlorotine biosynthesis protein O [Colletotrichum sidae]|uniref:Cyclochlorotine biosynthesis protein O n=1 Tax=Colletotrichum sidae TaxID=1347389 RepID=A0A4R8TME0_9PEZI|nr:Cyclochlorotine biosynthesis protein O [Colletotrichum sidae]